MFLGNEASLCSELLGPGALDPGAVILPYYAHSFWRYASHQLCNIQVDFPAESILKLEELDSLEYPVLNLCLINLVLR